MTLGELRTKTHDLPDNAELRVACNWAGETVLAEARAYLREDFPPMTKIHSLLEDGDVVVGEEVTPCEE